MAGPWYFAWVNATDTVFSSAFYRWDEHVYSAVRIHEEGHIPTLDITIRNPGIGILAPGRSLWAWLSRDNGFGTILPVFFGQVTAIQTVIVKEICTIRLIAQAIDWVAQKQQLAQTMKVRPFYAPVFYDDSHRY